MSAEDLKDVALAMYKLNHLDGDLIGDPVALKKFKDDYMIAFEYLYNNVAEANWSRENKYKKIYADFLSQLTLVAADGLTAGNSTIHLKMRFSYAVTLMESCLQEMLKSVTMQYEVFRRNAIINIEEIKSMKISAPVLLDKDPVDILDAAILGHLSRLLYHNMDKVKKVYPQILGEDFPIISESLNKVIPDLMNLRHDIVHRNGKNIDGEEIIISTEMVESGIRDIRNFVEGVYDFINQSIDKLSEKKTD